MNEDELPDCEECLKLMVEDLAKSVADPKNLALLPPEEAEKATQHLRELLDRPNDSLEQLARVLAARAKAAVGSYEQ
jgi:hypothetical protein